MPPDPPAQPKSLACLPAFREAVARWMELRFGLRFDPFYTFLMSSRPFGRFDRFIGFSPPFVL